MLPTFSSFLMLLGMSPAMEASYRPAEPCCEEPEVCLEVRLVQAAPALANRLMGPSNNGPCLLAPQQLVHMLEEFQGDRRATIMQAPKLAILDGQTGTMEIGHACPHVLNHDGHMVHGFIGTKFKAQTVITADRKRVQVDMQFEHSEPLDPETSTKGLPRLARTRFESKVTIPDGQTLVLAAGPVEMEKRVEYTPPVLSRIPYINRLFKNVGYGRESKQLLVFVTPRIKPGTCPVVAAKAMPRLLPEFELNVMLPLNGISLMAHRVPVMSLVMRRQLESMQRVPTPDIGMLGTPGVKYDVKVDQMSLGTTIPMNAEVTVKGVLPEPTAERLAVWPKPWTAMTRLASDEPTTVAELQTNAEPPCCIRACAAHIKAAPASNTLSLADVVALSQAGVSDEVIINQIRTTNATFELTTQDLLNLSKQRVSDTLILTMQNARSVPTRIRSIDLNGIERIGVEAP